MENFTIDSPKVSVIMGIYNCSTTLAESIDSILAQTYKNWELILCDDNSTDDTYRIAREYAEKYNNIILLRNEKNMGLAATLNRCLEYVSGKYVARMDGDDISLPERFQKQVAFLESNPEYSVVGTGMISFDEKGDIGIKLGIPEPKPTDLAKNNPFMHATIMMRTEVYKALNGYRVTSYTRRTEDIDLWFRFFAAGFKGYNMQEALYKVREDRTAYKRRKFKYYLDAARLLFEGIRLLNLPARYYLFVLKPILSGLTPNFLLKKYHEFRVKKSKMVL
ncbi:glycosyl transferase [Geobacillus sp. Manikaran-105]|uniref:glycosyltransferase family 2 protein n=1 Tax=Geobacillus sp. Manikaran-105 TaxID=2055940 RepID=UPI000C28AF0D|nr:glycosyltransferase [Geobacillus sp. Manikaran-105]PJW13250.1 glycosyl transferase [Geobacillus sp. Manikaran-105]